LPPARQPDRVQDHRPASCAAGRDGAQQLNVARRPRAAAAERKAAGAPQANVANLQKNGVVQAFLDEDSISYSVMTRDADGKLVLQCVTGATAAKETMSIPATIESKEHQHEVQ
jgi:hypothetical protein